MHTHMHLLIYIYIYASICTCINIYIQYIQLYVVDWMNRNHQAPLSRAPFLGIKMMVSCRWPLRCPNHVQRREGIFESTMPFSDQEKAEKEKTSLDMCFELFFPPLRCCRFRLSEKLYQLVSWLHHHLDSNTSNDITPESTEYIQARQLKSTRLLMNFALKLHRLIQSTTGHYRTARPSQHPSCAQACGWGTPVM